MEGEVEERERSAVRRGGGEKPATGRGSRGSEGRARARKERGRGASFGRNRGPWHTGFVRVQSAVLR